MDAAPAGRVGALAKAAIAVAAWGASFVATKVALRELSPVGLVWARFAIGVVVLGAIVAARRQMAAVRPREVAYFALLGFIGITLHQWLQSNGLVTSEATTTGWIIASTPLFIAILGRVFLREPLGPGAVTGILVATAGVLVVASRGELGALSLGRLGAPGDALILLSAPNWAVYTVLARHGLKRHPAARMMFYVMALGWLFTTALLCLGIGGGAAAAVEPEAARGGAARLPAVFGDLGRLSPAGWASVAFLGVICSGLAYVFWHDALERVPASRVGALLYLEPLMTVAVAWAVLGEPVRVAVVFGGLTILAGIWLVERERSTA